LTYREPTSNETLRFDKKERDVLLGILDRRLHRAIELDQLIILSAEILKEKLDNAVAAQWPTSHEASEILESVASKSSEIGSILQEVRRSLKQLSASEEKLDSQNKTTSNSS
jgi:hypothetical protein